jgi:hypothetical protein
MTTAAPTSLAIPTPWREPLAYDQVEVAGRLWTGLAKLEGFDQPYEWQINKGQGTDGASTAYQGGGIAEPSITFFLWEGVDDKGALVNYFADWEAFKPILEASIPPPGSGKDPTALAIRNPIAEHAKIRAISIKKIGQLTPDGDGGATVKVDLIDFRKPKKAGGTPQAAAENAPGARPKTEIELAVENESKTTGDLLTQAEAAP